MDPNRHKILSCEAPSKEKHNCESGSGDNYAAAKTKFHQTADLLGAMLTQEMKRRPADSELSDRAASKKTIAELEHKIRNLKAEIYDAKEALAEQRDRGGSGACMDCTQNAAASDELKRKLKSARTLLEREQKQHEETKKELAERMSNISQLMVENGGMKVELVTFRSERVILVAELTELKQQRDTMSCISQQQYNQLALEKAAAESALQEALATSRQLLEEKAAAQAAVELAKREKTDVATLQEDSAALAKYVAKLTTQLAKQAMKHEAERSKDAAEAAERSGRLEDELAAERRKVTHSAVMSTTPNTLFNAETINTNTNTYANTNTNASTRSTVNDEEPSVLSANTQPTSAAVAQTHAAKRTVIQHRATFKAMENITRVYLSNANLNDTEVMMITEPFGPLVSIKELEDIASFMVEFKYEYSARMAMTSLHGSVQNGVCLSCTPYVEPEPRKEVRTVSREDVVRTAAASRDNGTSSINTNAVVPDPQQTSHLTSEGFVKEHLLCVYMLHHAPRKFKMTEENVQREFSRYGKVRKIKYIERSESYMVMFYDQESATNALRDFPSHFNGFRVTCARNHPALVTAAKAVKEVKEKKGPSGDCERGTDRAPQRLVLNDPVLLAENRSSFDARAENRSRTTHLFCEHCESAGRRHLVNTHCSDRCFYMRKANEECARSSGNSNGYNHNLSNSSARLSVGYDRKRSRSRSPERPARKCTSSATYNVSGSSAGRSRDASADCRSVNSGNFSVIANSGTFDPVTGVRPLSTSR